jgi:hypothetical protein
VVGVALDAPANRETMMLHLTTAAQIGAALPIGLLFGAAYFLSLHWAVRLISGVGVGGYGYAKALIIQCVRFALLAAVFFVLAKIGTAALLSGALGLLLARQLVLHRARSAP